MSAIKWAYQRFVEQEFPLPSEESIAAVEERIGRKFPEHYREYLLEFNGGIFNEPHIRLTPDGKGVDRLTFSMASELQKQYANLPLKVFWRLGKITLHHKLFPSAVP